MERNAVSAHQTVMTLTPLTLTSGVLFMENSSCAMPNAHPSVIVMYVRGVCATALASCTSNSDSPLLPPDHGPTMREMLKNGTLLH